ncbi:hypothetical protein C8Z91_22685 [Paenibacillus elgii]|uniref:Uncharacterized protein n=1 Tax=Paenibacillus elgii TaxID=189691 RepID=A0A2T6FYK2_9BACL|nr:hypothetical protein C8Z91_22685 [Paenibacillus elgii]
MPAVAVILADIVTDNRLFEISHLLPLYDAAHKEDKAAFIVMSVVVLENMHTTVGMVDIEGLGIHISTLAGICALRISYLVKLPNGIDTLLGESSRYEGCFIIASVMAYIVDVIVFDQRFVPPHNPDGVTAGVLDKVAAHLQIVIKIFRMIQVFGCLAPRNAPHRNILDPVPGDLHLLKAGP